MGNSPIIYLAPGAGLGHLVRAGGVVARLLELGLDARVATNSPYAQAIARLTRLPIDQLPDQRWQNELPDYVAQTRARLLILDTFPWGIRGEWLDPAPAGIEFVYLARRLQIDPYLKTINRDWIHDSPQLRRVIVSEPLTNDHERLLANANLIRLPGRVKSPHDLADPPVPTDLQTMLDRGRAWLVVHSGPQRETSALLKHARQSMPPDHELALISPRPPADHNAHAFDYFPAARLFASAHRVVSGAGYNLVSEMSPWPDKHIALPFARTYDDQAGRLKSSAMDPVDGAPTAARFIAACLDH